MSPSQSAQSPLARLVVFIIVLSVAGSIAAGAVVAATHPGSGITPPPENKVPNPEDFCKDCISQCTSTYGFSPDQCAMSNFCWNTCHGL